MGEISTLLIAIIVVMVALVYALRLQRRAVVTQTAVVDEHFAERAQRQRQYLVAEQCLDLQKLASAQTAETLEILRRAATREEEAHQFLKRSLELQDQILKVLRESHK